MHLRHVSVWYKIMAERQRAVRHARTHTRAHTHTETERDGGGGGREGRETERESEKGVREGRTKRGRRHQWRRARGAIASNRLCSSGYIRRRRVSVRRAGRRSLQRTPFEALAQNRVCRARACVCVCVRVAQTDAARRTLKFMLVHPAVPSIP